MNDGVLKGVVRVLGFRVGSFTLRAPHAGASGSCAFLLPTGAHSLSGWISSKLHAASSALQAYGFFFCGSAIIDRRSRLILMFEHAGFTVLSSAIESYRLLLHWLEGMFIPRNPPIYSKTLTLSVQVPNNHMRSQILP